MPRIRYTNERKVSAKPIPDGTKMTASWYRGSMTTGSQSPTITIMMARHSQTVAIAAPTIIDALGTRPMRRGVAVSAVIGSAT